MNEGVLFWTQPWICLIFSPHALVMRCDVRLVVSLDIIKPHSESTAAQTENPEQP